MVIPRETSQSLILILNSFITAEKYVTLLRQHVEVTVAERMVRRAESITSSLQ